MLEVTFMLQQQCEQKSQLQRRRQHHSEGSPSLFPSPLTNEREAIQPNFKWTLLLYKLGLLG